MAGRDNGSLIKPLTASGVTAMKDAPAHGMLNRCSLGLDTADETVDSALKTCALLEQAKRSI